MGRYILRRKALATLILGVTGIAGSAAAPPLPSRQAVPAEITRRVIESPSAYLSPRQNHAAGKSWSVGILQSTAERADVRFWIDEWSSEQGLEKMRISHERIREFRKEVDSIIRRSTLPWEVAAIPVVESNWRVAAVSSSGAAGPWQFLEASARGRNLVIDAWRDDRRDIWRSTEAAMSELAFYDRLFSDWLIAAASYNAGPTRIRRLKEAGGFSTFWEMLDAGVIPPETRDYVPQLIAVAWVSAHAGRLGLPIIWEEPETWVRIPVNRSVHLEEMARQAGIPLAQAYRAHRELNHPMTPPPTLPYQLKVPERSAEATRLWLEDLDEDDAPERFWRYTVRSGDTLSELAGRYGISLSELLSYNSHVRSGVLRIGERLYLPGDRQPLPGTDPDELPDWRGRHTVEPGESLWSIARSYTVPPELLAEVNHRPMNTVLLAGSVLKVPAETEEEP